jgi:predicted Fe-Mo cluster-binding NifX family protein
MKIAVASEDGVSISHHFGRSRCFLIFETDEKRIVSQSLRDNRFTPHALGECQEGQPHQHHHGHGPIINALKDCEVVLCYGMGWRAAEDLKQNGIRAFVIQGEVTPEQAVNDYLAGKLALAGDFCRCHQ